LSLAAGTRLGPYEILAPYDFERALSTLYLVRGLR
jgi:hypothetical protein